MLTILEKIKISEFLEENNFTEQDLLDYAEDEGITDYTFDILDNPYELICKAVHLESPRTAKLKDDIKQICADIIEFNYINSVR